MIATPRYAYPEAIVSTGWLAEHLGDPALRIYDCTTYLYYETGTGQPYRVESGRGDYQQGHIPGSAFLDLQGELSDPGSPDQLHDAGARRSGLPLRGDGDRRGHARHP